MKAFDIVFPGLWSHNNTKDISDISDLRVKISIIVVGIIKIIESLDIRIWITLDDFQVYITFLCTYFYFKEESSHDLVF